MSSPAEEPCPTADGVGRVEDCRWGSSGEEGEDDLSSDDEEDVVPFGLGSARRISSLKVESERSRCQ